MCWLAQSALAFLAVDPFNVGHLAHCHAVSSRVFPKVGEGSRDEDGGDLPRRGWICPDVLFKIGLNRSAPIGLDEVDWIANEGSNPVAPALNNTLKLRTMVRSFSFSPSAGSIISRTRDFSCVIRATTRFQYSWHTSLSLHQDKSGDVRRWDFLTQRAHRGNSHEPQR